MIVAETPRLLIRHLTAADAAFTVQLLNEPSFINNIADRGVRTLEDALHYLADGPIKSYQKHGYGLFLVELASTGEALGFCGLLYRDYLLETDIGFAFLPQYWGQGYALEAAKAVVQYGYHKLCLPRIVGLTSAGNIPSVKVLTKLGLQFEKTVVMQPQQNEVMLFS